jgi:hypothetical protein
VQARPGSPAQGRHCPAGRRRAQDLSAPVADRLPQGQGRAPGLREPERRRGEQGRALGRGQEVGGRGDRHPQPADLPPAASEA